MTLRTLVQATILSTVIPTLIHAQNWRRAQPVLGARSAPVIEQRGFRFKDLNRNGVLDAYEDWRLSPAKRARDLVARMTLEEKAGLMMHGTARTGGALGVAGVGTQYDPAVTGKLIREAHVNSFITRLGGAPSLAAENNKLQEIAEATPLGIPLTISTDPRNHFQYVLGASAQSARFSQWPETLGLAATRDPALVRRFADIARQEYRAVGIQETLPPQADLATEPRWARINGTFGEDADLAQKLVRAYVEGFQHGAQGVDTRYGFTVVSDPSQADIAIVRTNAPFETLHPSYMFGSMQHEGNLEFKSGDPEFEEIKRITAAVPTIVTIYLDRPAILGSLRDRVAALIANFGVSDAALLDVITGKARPEGRLPFELPSSMQEVGAQRSDLPHDTAHPLYPIGFGLRY